MKSLEAKPTPIRTVSSAVSAAPISERVVASRALVGAGGDRRACNSDR